MKRRSAVKDRRAGTSPYARHGKRPYRYPASVVGSRDALAPLPLAELVAWRWRNGERGEPS